MKKQYLDEEERPLEDWRMQILSAAMAYATAAVSWSVSDDWTWTRLIAVISVAQGIHSTVRAVLSWREAREREADEW